MTLIHDLMTGLIFNQTFNSESVHYDADYRNEQALSRIFQPHLHEISNIVSYLFHRLALIEVGCENDHSLEHLQSPGFQFIGLDQTYEGNNPERYRKYFGPEINLAVDGIILRHVLEHAQDPVGFLARILDTNGGRAKIDIEVPCVYWICRFHAWFDIFHVPLNYFRIADFGSVFGIIIESGHTLDGQYLDVMAELALLRVTGTYATSQLGLPSDFPGKVRPHAAMLRGISVTKTYTNHNVSRTAPRKYYLRPFHAKCRFQHGLCHQHIRPSRENTWQRLASGFRSGRDRRKLTSRIGHFRDEWKLPA